MPVQYRLLLAKQAEVNDMLDDMKNWEVIKESDGPWSSPMMLVWKKNGDLYWCTNYRKLNDITKKDCFMLPRIDDTLDILAGAKLLTLNLKSSYWQVALHPNDKEDKYSSQVRGCGSSWLCLSASAMLRQCLNG
jgi:hypothetical protein